MKKLILSLLLGTSFMVQSCNKDIHKMEVIEDCTGVYLRDNNGQDHYVCNEEILDGLATGTKIKVSYDKLEQCFGLLNEPTCSDTHIFSGVIEVTEIH